MVKQTGTYIEDVREYKLPLGQLIRVDRKEDFELLNPRLKSYTIGPGRLGKLLGHKPVDGLMDSIDHPDGRLGKATVLFDGATVENRSLDFCAVLGIGVRSTLVRPELTSFYITLYATPQEAYQAMGERARVMVSST